MKDETKLTNGNTSVSGFQQMRYSFVTRARPLHADGTGLVYVFLSPWYHVDHMKVRLHVHIPERPGVRDTEFLSRRSAFWGYVDMTTALDKAGKLSSLFTPVSGRKWSWQMNPNNSEYILTVWKAEQQKPKRPFATESSRSCSEGFPRRMHPSLHIHTLTHDFL